MVEVKACPIYGRSCWGCIRVMREMLERMESESIPEEAETLISNMESACERNDADLYSMALHAVMLLFHHRDIKYGDN